ncbi:DNA polymerase V [Cucurbita moschata]|uniref:DNA polymerase V n=1 Tax=Cucurbita moschata TaxID=3662 RepID=A0A6J1GLP7_CUCMO|nr:DNA polymerase V [Cucurbita moschata]
MDGKKRGSNPTDGVEIQKDTLMVDVSAVPKSLKRKMKKDKQKDAELENGDVDVSSSSFPDSEKPMERKKKRKTFDKERKRAVSESEEPKAKQTSVKVKADETKPSSVSVSSSGLPEFHISVFKDLASADILVRESAAEALATELLKVQQAYEKLENKDLVEGGLKLEAEKDDGLDNCAPSVRYAVRRLIRGVSSSRECARQGFALGLTALIGTQSNVKVDSLLKLITNILEVSSSMKGQEARDCLLGRLFAYGALVHSGRLTEECSSDKNSSHVKEITSVLISLAAKKRYLQEPAVLIIVELVEKLTPESVLNHVLEAPGIQEWFEAATEVGNPDALLLALKLREKVSADCPTLVKLLPNPFNPSRFFSVDHLSSLVNCFKESTFCQPRVHSLWPVLLNILLPDTVLQAQDALSVSISLKKHKKNRKSGSSEEEILVNFKNFFEVVIEGALLLSSHDRKHLVFDVLLHLLPRLPANFIPAMLSYKVVQCLMDILSTKDSWLHKVVQNFLKELSEWALHDDVRKVSVVVALQKHSNGKFDSITRTKAVQHLMSEFKTESGCFLFIQNLMSMFVDESQTSEEPSDQSQTTDDNSEVGSVEDKDSIGTMGNSDFLRTWIIESLPCMLKHLKLEPEAKFRVQKEVLKFLAVQGLFTASLGTEVTSFELQEKFKWPKAPTSSALCMMCIEQLQLLLANAQKGEGSHGLVNGLEPNDLGSYFMRFLSTLRNIPSVSLFRRLSDEDEDAFKKLQEMETRLWREERNYGLSADANKLHALRYLLIQLLLQVLLRPEEFTEAATELIICCKKAFSSADLLGSSGDDELDGDGTPQLMDVLVDTLLSLLPQSSAPMRSAIEQVFKYFCCDITDDGLMRMLRVVKKNLKPSRHHNAEDGDEDEDEDEDGDFLDVEDEEINQDEDSDEHTDESEAIDKVGEVGQEHSDGSDDSESDGGMDDDAMFRMDSYLAQIFKERKNQAGSETAQSQLMLFKLRVLSLLEIYLHENPGKPNVLLVLSNLAQALVNPHTTEGSEQLEQRIWGILQKKIFKAKDYPKGEAVQMSTLENLLEKNLKLASKPTKKKKSAANVSKKKQTASLNHYKMITSLGQNSSFWILKIIDAKKVSKPELQKVFDIFDKVLVDYFHSKKSQIKAEFLKEIIRRRPWVGHHLYGSLLERCVSTNSEFRRIEALDLITEMIKSSMSSENGHHVTKELMENFLHELCNLIKELLTNMPEKQARRADVRKFCGKIFHFVSSLNISKSFLSSLAPEAVAVCESQLGEQFSKLKQLKHRE